MRQPAPAQRLGFDGLDVADAVAANTSAPISNASAVGISFAGAEPVYGVNVLNSLILSGCVLFAGGVRVKFAGTVLCIDGKGDMIWNDPWIDLATTPPAEGEGVAPFCTTLPPPRPTLPPNLHFSCVAAATLGYADLTGWRDLVGTRWDLADLRVRLAGAYVARIHKEGHLVSTCVLRRLTSPQWILETLVARPTGHGHATALVRSAMTWLWDAGGPFILTYTWELTVSQMIWAWWRGWLKSAVSVKYGWIWRGSTACQFCGTNERRTVPEKSLVSRNGIIVSDSGLGDGLGYVLSLSSESLNNEDWSAIANHGGWRALWWQGERPPDSTWRWTGEIVIVGMLNYDGRSRVQTHWITTEIAPATRS